MSATRTKRSLSPARQRLVELMQEINFGRIEAFDVCGGEPVLEPAPRVLRDFLLGKTNAAHQSRARDALRVAHATSKPWSLAAPSRPLASAT